MKTITRIAAWIIKISLPVFILMTAIRLMFTPVFLQVEYRMPGFPADSYGFDMEDRLHFARISIDYLLSNRGIDYLGDLQFQDGSPLFNERELGHMVDVKNLLQAMLLAWRVLAFILLVLGIWAMAGGWLELYGRAVNQGGWGAVALVILVLAAVVINFDALFTAFHRVFFTGDTWLFLYSDTLIRLFPMRFWQDAFIGMGIFTVLGGLLAVFLGKRVQKLAPVRA